MPRAALCDQCRRIRERCRARFLAITFDGRSQVLGAMTFTVPMYRLNLRGPQGTCRNCLSDARSSPQSSAFRRGNIEATIERAFDRILREWPRKKCSLWGHSTSRDQALITHTVRSIDKALPDGVITRSRMTAAVATVVGVTPATAIAPSHPRRRRPDQPARRRRPDPRRDKPARLPVRP